MPTGSARRTFAAYEFIALACVILALRIGYSLVLRFDSDEPQHLHVVWAWATGRLPYKDVFDNHAPLFQFLCAPLFRLIPERPDIVIPMRWAMLPLYGLAVYAVYRLGAVFYSRKLALLIAVSGSLLPPYFLKSVEFRPDDLWAAVWFLSVAVLMEGPATIRRSFLFGLWLGVSFAVSMKTTLFVLALGVALAILLGLKLLDKKEHVHWKLLAKCVGVATLGALLVPAVVVAYFWLRGIPREFYYGVIEHNIVPHLKRWQKPGYLQRWFPFTLAGLLISAVVIYRGCTKAELRDRMVFTFLLPGCYVLMLYGFWPDIPREDDLPLYPLVPLACWLLAGALLPLANRERIQRFSTGLAWSVIVLQIAWLLVTKRPWERDNRVQIGVIAKILQLTKPDEYVMDAKSGAIYRQRPFFYALETITIDRIRKKMITENIRQRLVETGTKVAMLEAMLDGSKSRAFVIANYLPLKQRNNLRVVGKLLVKDGSTLENVYHFDVAISAKYSIVDKQGRVPGTLDGSPCDGTTELGAGQHEFRPSGEPAELALFWDRALEKGYQPEFPEAESSPDKSKPGG